MAGAHHDDPHPEGHMADDMNLVKIVVIGLISLGIFAVGVVWSTILLSRGEREREIEGKAGEPKLMGREEIGIVDQVPFDRDRRLEIWRAERQKALHGWGWADRDRGTVRIPIERAMDWVVADPPDIAGEGVPPAAVAPVPAPEPAQETGKRPRGGKRTRAQVPQVPQVPQVEEGKR
jgi:hypothetical protein